MTANTTNYQYQYKVMAYNSGAQRRCYFDSFPSSRTIATPLSMHDVAEAGRRSCRLPARPDLVCSAESQGVSAPELGACAPFAVQSAEGPAPDCHAGQCVFTVVYARCSLSRSLSMPPRFGMSMGWPCSQRQLASLTWRPADRSLITWIFVCPSPWSRSYFLGVKVF